jgi:hypothetical protein
MERQCVGMAQPLPCGPDAIRPNPESPPHRYAAARAGRRCVRKASTRSIGMRSPASPP